MKFSVIQSDSELSTTSKIFVVSEGTEASSIPLSMGAIKLPKAGEFRGYTDQGREVFIAVIKNKNHFQGIAQQIRQLVHQNRVYVGRKPELYIDLQEEEQVNAVITGLMLSTYNIGYYKSLREDNPNIEELFFSQPNMLERINHVSLGAEAQMRAMELVDRSPSEKNPQFLANWAEKSGRDYGYHVQIIRNEEVLQENLHALFAVGKGSKHPPLMIVSWYKGNSSNDTFDLGLVGKGVTFDTGGISIKPSANMHYMKSDMAGAAAVLATMELAARKKLNLNICAAVPVAENAVDANSLLPGDVISSYSGQSIEVLDTDAEGRLILADALSWLIKNKKPTHVIDLATLTGSSVRTFATEAACLYTTSELLETKLRQAGEKSGERLWPMPLWPEYDQYLVSDVADIKNLASIPAAGSITAAKFLQRFTYDHSSWAHIDMPGMAFKDSSFTKMKSATGYGVHLLDTFLHHIINNQELSTR